jgi:hypothetical protein
LVEGRDILFETDDTWKSKYTGEETTPVPEAKEFTGPSILFGDPAVTPPWSNSIGFRYAGPMGLLEPISIEPGKITAKVIKDAPMKIDNLTLKRVFPDDKSEKINILAQVMGDFEKGNTITILYSVPPSFKSDAKLYLEDDYFTIVGNPLLADVKSSAMENEGFQKAEIFSLTGQKLMESAMEKMNVSSLSQGVYLLKVYDQSGNSETQRIVVK